MNTTHKCPSPQTQPLRCTIYDGHVKQALISLCYAANQICSKRLVPFLPELLEVLERHGHLSLPGEVREPLLAIWCGKDFPDKKSRNFPTLFLIVQWRLIFDSWVASLAVIEHFDILKNWFRRKQFDFREMQQVGFWLTQLERKTALWAIEHRSCFSWFVLSWA